MRISTSSTENTTGYIVEQTHEEEDFNFHFDSAKLTPLTINSKRAFNTFVLQQEWTDKREGRWDSSTSMHQWVMEQEPDGQELWDFHLTCQSYLSKTNAEAQT